MEIAYLKEFVVLAETENFLEAAERLYMSQSTLSRHLKRMEEELGIRLFERTTRSVAISTAGEVFLNYAQTITKSYEQAEKAICKLRKAEKEVLHIGVLPQMSRYHITETLSAFMQDQEEIRLQVTEGDSLKLLKMLEKEELDLAFVRTEGSVGSDLEEYTFFEDRLAAILHPRHPLARQSCVTIRDFSNEPLLLLDKDTFMYGLCVEKCREAGFEPEVVSLAHQASNLLDLAAGGMGSALLMKDAAAKMALERGLVVKEIDPPVYTRISLVWVKDGKHMDEKETFLSYLKKNCETQ